MPKALASVVAMLWAGWCGGGDAMGGLALAVVDCGRFPAAGLQAAHANEFAFSPHNTTNGWKSSHCAQILPGKCAAPVEG